jgi:two-component system cell cycle response regulator
VLTRRTPPVSVAYVGLGAVAAVLYFRAPGLSVDGRLPLYLAVSLSAAVAILVGVRRYRPERPLPWLLFAASQLVYFTADCTFYTYHDILHDARYPAPADAIYLAHYPLLALGLVLLGNRRRSSLVDTLILGTAFAVVVWIVLMDPYLHPAAGSLTLRLTSLAYPVMDLMVLFAALRLVGATVRVPAGAYLSASLLFLFFSDFVSTWLQVKGKYTGPGDFLDATWMTYYLLFGAAALSPSMRRLSDVKPAPPVRLGPVRIALLTAAAVTAPVASIVEHSTGKPGHDYAIAVASIISFVLVIARLAGVANAERSEQAEKDRLLHRVVAVAEHERVRVATDIYDGPIQKLSALALRLDLLRAARPRRSRGGDDLDAPHPGGDRRRDTRASAPDLEPTPAGHR